MLHHEDRAEAPTTTTTTGSEAAADFRVTAEEFARALTRYQARREQAAQRMEGTVAIGDAVHELGLEATPEEILAEVQAERRALEQRAPQTVQGPVSRRTRRVFAAASAAGVLLLAGTGLFFIRAAQTTGPSVTPAIQIQTAAPSPLVTISAPPRMLVQDNTSGKPVLKTLAEIPENVPVQCVLEMTASHAAFVDFTNPDTAWTLIKHGGQVYVRGWIADMSLLAVRTSTVNLYSQKNLVPLSFAPKPVMLRIDGFQTNPALGAADTIVAEHVQPDPHFAERW